MEKPLGLCLLVRETRYVSAVSTPGSFLLRGWVCCHPSSVPCQTLLCLQTGFEPKYLKKSSPVNAMGPGSDPAGTCPPQAHGTVWLCAGKQRRCTLASTGLMARWGSLRPGQHKKQHIWLSDVFYVRGGGCTPWLAGLKCLGCRRRQRLGSPALPLAGRAPCFAPCCR